MFNNSRLPPQHPTQMQPPINMSSPKIMKNVKKSQRYASVVWQIKNMNSPKIIRKISYLLPRHAQLQNWQISLVRPVVLQFVVYIETHQ